MNEPVLNTAPLVRAISDLIAAKVEQTIYLRVAMPNKVQKEFQQQQVELAEEALADILSGALRHHG